MPWCLRRSGGIPKNAQMLLCQGLDGVKKLSISLEINLLKIGRRDVQAYFPNVFTPIMILGKTLERATRTREKCAMRRASK